jgi:hypothetical protein
VRCSDDFGSLDGTTQVAGNNGVNGLTGQTPGHLSSLFPTPLVETALRLALHNLAGIVNGLTVTY